MSDLCGEDHFYLEVQPALYNDQILYNGLLLRLSQETNIPLVVATDTHYLNKEDFELHKVFLNSQRENSAVRETEAFYKYTYLMPEDEVRANLKANPNFTDAIVEQCIQNTYKISDMCEEYDISSPTYLMETPEREQGWEQWLEQKYGLYVDKIPALELYYNSKEIDRYFIYMVLSKYEKKVSKGWITKKERTVERIQEELDVIFAISNRINENLSKYFLTMKDLLNIMWEISVIGAGRGSAGASMINFLFDITSLNPLEVYDDFELPFWRFLDKDRPELPDIDLDNSASRKEEILKLVSDYVSTFNHTIAKVATFGKLKSKQALQVAAGGLGYEPEIKTYLSSMVPIHRGFPLGLKECVETGVFADVMEEFSDVIKLAIEIEGLVVSVGQHAAAITFFNNNDKFSRTAFIKRPKDNIPTTAFDLHMLEELGAAIKFDTLQTVAVDALQTSIMLLVENGEIEWQGTLKKTYDKYLHPSVINHTDKRIWNKICNKQVYSLFQFETPVGEQGIREGQPQSLMDLSNLNSVIRLMVPEGKHELPLYTFKKYKENIGLWYFDMKQYGLNESEIEIVKKYLSISYGVCITQEQLMMMSMDEKISGFSMKLSNKLRKSVAKKQVEMLEEVKQEFFKKGKELGTRDVMLNYVWNECFMMSAGYGLDN